MSFCCFAFCLSAAHSANIDEKVHKPQSYWSSGCPGKKGDQEENKKRYIGSDSNFISYTCSPFFTLGLTILANIRKNRPLYVVISLRC